jgi:hypothetical protein
MQSQTIDRINDRMKSNRSGGCPELRYLLLSTSLLVDRVFLYTDLIPTLKKHGEVSVWASSCDGPNEESIWKNTGVEVEGFPYVAAFREMPHNFLRRFNEYIWDYRYEVPSRLSMMRHVRDRNAPALIRALKPPAKLMAMMRTERLIEEKLEKLLLSYPRSAEAEHRLKQTRPDVIVSTGRFSSNSQESSLRPKSWEYQPWRISRRGTTCPPKTVWFFGTTATSYGTRASGTNFIRIIRIPRTIPSTWSVLPSLISFGRKDFIARERNFVPSRG